MDNIRADFAYTAVGQLAQIARWADKERTTSAGTTDLAHNLAGRPKQIVHKNAADEVLAGYDYDLDFSGMLTKETLTHINAEYSRTANYGYDQRGQLISAMYDNDQQDESYAYDANGNRTESHLHGAGYVTGAGNQLLSDGTFDYTYDHEGNMVTKTRITPVDGEVNYTEFVYDFHNRMTALTQYSRNPNDGGVILDQQTYKHDALGRRVQVISDGQEIISLYDGASFVDNLWARLSADGQYTDRSLFGDRVDMLIAQQENGISWILADHLGSVRDVMNHSGQLTQTIGYNAFGVPFFMNPVGQTAQSTFTGREFDKNSGLLYYRTRLLDPATGRFTSQDPLAFSATDSNLYRYVFNNPLRFTDATGMIALVSHTVSIKVGGQDAILAGIGALHGFGASNLFAAGAALQFAGQDDFGAKVVAEVEKQLAQLRDSLSFDIVDHRGVKLGVGLAGGAAAFFYGVEVVSIEVPILSASFSHKFLGGLLQLKLTIGVTDYDWDRSLAVPGFFDGADLGVARLKHMFGVG